MSLSIRTNVASLNAQKNLSATQTALDSSLSRLSSGFRITRAGDDAAGLGISSKLESQIRSYNQATRNANDGLSVVQASEAALNEQASILTRLRELAMQSASDGIGDSERGYVDTEARALVGELERISQVTEYNGQKLLDGSAITLDFQVGIQNSATGFDRISLTTINATTAGASGTVTGIGPAAATTGPAAAILANVATTFATTFQATDNVDTAANAADALGVTQSGAVGLTNEFYGFARGVFSTAYWQSDGFPHFAPMADSPGRAAAIALVAATASGGTGGDPLLAAAFQAYAADIGAGGTGVSATAAAGTAATNAALAMGSATMAGSENIAGSDAASAADSLFRIASQVGGGTAAGLAALGYATTTSPATTGGLGVAGLSLATKGSARAALATIDSALSAVSSARSTLGATGNRLQSAVTTIQSYSESLSAANSRIRDVDVAEETSRMSRSQILSQAGVSVLAQANQMPQLALKLLG